MAARENQGLQIAVMIFFVLVVLLAVMTYVFFKQADDFARQNKAQSEELAKKELGIREINDEANALKVMIGFKAEDELGKKGDSKPGTVFTEYQKDIETYGAGFEGESKGYRQLVEYLANQNKNTESKFTDITKLDEDFKKKLAVVETGAKEEFTKELTGKDSAIGDLEKERGKFNADRDRSTKLADDTAKQLEELRQKAEDEKKPLEEAVKKLATEREKLSQINADLREKLRTRSEGAESPDGAITQVNQRTNTVWINIGSDDQLQRQMVFAVYPQAESQLTESKKKASIEVTRILDRHMAEARVITDSSSDPIVPGDKIASPAWNRGRRDQFVLVGFMDINGDGKSDRQRVKDLITLHGGEIVCELGDDGKITGKVELTTRYVILGDAPTGKESEKDLIENFSKLTGQATELGIEKMPLKRFLSQMGYQPDERTVQLGKAASSRDFKAKPPEGVQPQSTGNTSVDFRKRERPKNAF